MAEAQAVDRVHRIGQTRGVAVTRYIMDDSIEMVSQDGLKWVIDMFGGVILTEYSIFNGFRKIN